MIFFQNLTIYYQKILTMRYRTGQFNRQENRDMMALQGLSEAWKEVLYSDIVDTIYGTRVDALCGNWTGGTVAIEIKYREQGTLTDTYWMKDDIYIEPGKLKYLNSLWDEYRIAPLYCNFFNGGTEALIWVIPTIKRERMTYYPTAYFDKEDNEWKARYGLKIKDAYRFHFDGYKWKMISKPKDVQPMGGKAAQCDSPEVTKLITEITKYNGLIIKDLINRKDNE